MSPTESSHAKKVKKSRYDYLKIVYLQHANDSKTQNRHTCLSYETNWGTLNLWKMNATYPNILPKMTLIAKPTNIFTNFSYSNLLQQLHNAWANGRRAKRGDKLRSSLRPFKRFVRQWLRAKLPLPNHTPTLKMLFNRSPKWKRSNNGLRRRFTVPQTLYLPENTESIPTPKLLLHKAEHTGTKCFESPILPLKLPS